MPLLGSFCMVIPEMDRVLIKSQVAAMDKAGNIVLDIESLTQSSDKCCAGSPKMIKALSRKGSCRMERRGDEQEVDEASRKLVIKVMPSQLEQLKQPSLPNKALVASTTPASSPSLVDAGDGRIKRFNRLTTIHPRKVMLFFATMSSMGTMILIYFTLAINRRGGA